MSKHRQFTAEFKTHIVLEVLSGTKSVAEPCRQHSLKPQLLSNWKSEFLEHARLVFQRDEQRSTEQARIAELERLVGRLTLELEAAKKVWPLWNAASTRNERSS